MQTKDQRTTRSSAASSSTTSRRPLESAFTPAFLERARRREASRVPGVDPSSTDLALEAHFAGPWDVERVPAGRGALHAAVRRGEPARRGGGARLACIERQDACLGAAAFVGVATPNRLSVNADKPSGRRSPLGHPVHDGGRHLGHLAPSVAVNPEAAERFLASFHTLRALAADPDAAALFIEALDAETLAVLGRAILRRVGGGAQ